MNAGAPTSVVRPGLIQRLIALAWSYRSDCIRVMLLQIILLTIGMAGLSLTGVGIDFIRHDLDPASAAPKWPFGLPLPTDLPARTALLFLGLGILLLACTRGFLTFAYTIALSRFVQGKIVVDLRSKVYEKLQHLDFRFFDRNASGSIINRVTGDVQSVRMFVDGVLMEGLILVLSLAVYLAYMFSIHVPLTVVCLLATPGIWIASARFTRLVRPAYRRNRQLVDAMILTFSEHMQGIPVIKGFALEKWAEKQFRERIDEVRDQKWWIFDKASFYSPLIGLFSQINLVLLLAYGGWLVVNNEIPLGAGLIVFASILQQFSGQIANIANIANSMQQSMVAADRVFEILDEPLKVSSPPNAIHPGKIKGHVLFQKVSFSFREGESAIREIDLEVKPGQCVAIVGATGSGKSALLSLIPRFYDPSAGQVRIDGVDVRDYDLKGLRKNIGLVFQESFLFSSTVAANIAFGHPGATDEQIRRAARIACADQFIEELPKGYDSVLGEAGSDLSGGQRQRLAIARAVLLEPSLLILDDPTAAIDPETEGEILTAMDQAKEGRTTFLVASRLSTLRRSDFIIVLDNGKIVEQGTHRELLGRAGPYRQLADLQLSNTFWDEQKTAGGVS